MRVPSWLRERGDALIVEVLELGQGPDVCEACGDVAGWLCGGVSCPRCYLASVREWERRGGITSDMLCDRLSETRHRRLYLAFMAWFWDQERVALEAADVAARVAHGFVHCGYGMCRQPAVKAVPCVWAGELRETRPACERHSVYGPDGVGYWYGLGA